MGQPETGQDAVRNLLTHLSVSNAAEGVRRTIGTFGYASGNQLVYSRFEDVGTVFPERFPGAVHHSAFLRYQADFWGTHSPGAYDDGEAGNYSDTYAGTDGNGDGIGDTPHGADRYPLVAPPPETGTYAATPPPPRVESSSPTPGDLDPGRLSAITAGTAGRAVRPPRHRP